MLSRIHAVTKSPVFRGALVGALAVMTSIYGRKLYNTYQVRNLTPMRFNIGASTIDSHFKTIAKSWENADATVLKLNDSEVTYHNSLGYLTQVDNGIMPLYKTIQLFFNVATDKTVRERCHDAKSKIDELSVERRMNAGLFQKVKALKARADAGEVTLTHDEARVLKFALRDFMREGLDLPAEQQTALKELKKKLSGLANQYEKVCNDEKTTLEFTREQLKGLQDSWFDHLNKTEDGKYIVTLKYPDAIPILEQCIVPETRQTVEKAFNSRGLPSNKLTLTEIVKIREQIAHMMGARNHAAFVLEVGIRDADDLFTKMAKTPERVMDFSMGIYEKAKPLVDVELGKKLHLKEEECRELGLLFDGKINSWDNAHYSQLYEKKMFQVDQAKIQEYFPLDSVLQGMLKIFSTLLHVSYKEIKDPHVWHPDVKMFGVYDNLKDNELIGHFYLDLFPRDGKFGHACCEDLISSYRDEAGARVVPALSVVICNFPEPTPDKPSLLYHDDVATLFHEFGHCMHTLLGFPTTTELKSFAVEADFVETMSTLMENWVWEPTILKQLSCHYKTKEPLPDDLINQLVKSRHGLIGSAIAQQLTYGLFDQTIHSDASKDITEVMNEFKLKLTKIPVTEGTDRTASFGHMVGGYDAGYYGYLWSDVFSQDVFSVFKKEGLLNPEVGLRYRRAILEPAASEDAYDMLRSFLGRDPSDEAFFQTIRPVEE